MRRTQKNGRERGNPGNGLGPIQEWSPLARGTATKNKRDMRDREDRKRKSRGWDD